MSSIDPLATTAEAAPPQPVDSVVGVLAPDPPHTSERVRVDGKYFACGDERFAFRGVTYGTFKRRDDGALFPERAVIAEDFGAIADAGFTVVRTYTAPPDDLVDLAAQHGLRVLAGAFYADWRYLVGRSRREFRRVAREACDEVRRVARRAAGDPTVLALVLGNEVPADVVRWAGGREVSRALEDLVGVAREEDPELLVSYGNYPTTEYLLLPALDFLTVNVFLERERDFRAYLTRLHNLSDDRPVVLGEMGLDAGRGEELQAETLDWQLGLAAERGIAGTCVFSWTDDWWVADQRVEGWSFGLTTADRRPRPALGVARRWNRRTLVDLQAKWPSMSVVICAYNAEETLAECLDHVCALDYPDLEVVVVDDGSTDETAAIARRYGEVQVVSIPNGGLSNARNVGARAAGGEIVAFLDSDAFPPPEWPYLLALAFDTAKVGGVGGPNLPPPDESRVAQIVARSPGGPVHVLTSDDRAEHVPGCNMAFWREIVDDIGGFDPLFTSAGDDVDFCWRVLTAGWEIGFHPAAFVWHRRRSSVAGYLRQQRGYGRAEALVQARHPERFTAAGTARWRGSIYEALAPRVLRQRVYHGVFGSAAYQSVYRSPGHGLQVAHQIGVPVAALLVALAPLAVLGLPLAIPAVLGACFLICLAVADAWAARPPRHGMRAWGLRAGVAALHLLQPLFRLSGRIATRAPLARDGLSTEGLTGPPEQLAGGVILLPLAGSRADAAASAVECLRADGLHTIIGSGFEDFDARILGSRLVAGDLITSAHPEGSLQLRVRPRLRTWWYTMVAVVAVALAAFSPILMAVVLILAALDAAIGLWRVGPKARRAIARGAGG